MKTITIDATGKKLGRLATEIAMILQGKDSPDYMPHIIANVAVVVDNASKLDLAGRMEREYKTYSGYPGGLRLETAGHLKNRKGTEAVIRHAVSGMLPKNTHRSRLLAKLTINE